MITAALTPLSEAVDAAPPDLSVPLPAAVAQALWSRIAARLERGDPLITTGDFLAALAVEYRAVAGQDMPASLRHELAAAVTDYNRQNPQRYVARGVHNCVVHAFQSGCAKLAWDVPRIRTSGPASLARFKSRTRVRSLLQGIHLAPSAIPVEACVQHALDVVSGRCQPLERHAQDTPVTPLEPAPVPAEPLAEDTAQALRDGTVSQAEVETRQAEAAAARARLEARELSRVAEHADTYVQEGRLTADEGETVRRLADIDRREAGGQIDGAEASRLRNSLLTKEQRYALEKKLQGAVDHAVCFLQVFQAMQRISPHLDDGLRFLVQHKDILDEAHGPAARAAAGQALLEGRETLRLVAEIMDRKDQEVRMISVGLPPYSYVVKRRERLGNLTIEPDFVDQLRQLDDDAMSDLLHHEEAAVRVRPAADMRCLLAIVDYLIKPTPWRKDVRLLRVQDTIEAFYRDTDDLEEARKQAEGFLNQRLRRMFRDLSNDEKREMSARGADMIDTVERQVLAERQAAALDRGEGPTAEVTATEGDSLTAEELNRGATIARVEMRVAGQMRRVPRKIMRDPEDEERFVLAARNNDTGELEPVLRRGARRYVQRGSDGLWRLQSG